MNTSRVTGPLPRFVLIALSSFALTTAACGSGDQSGKPVTTQAAATSQATLTIQPTTTIRISLIPTTSNAALFLGLSRGYFKEEHVDLDTTFIATGSSVLAPLISGSLDIGQGGPSAGLFNTINEAPGKVKVIGSVQTAVPGESARNQGILVDAKLGIRDARTAVAKRLHVAILAKGQNMEYYTRLWLDKSGQANATLGYEESSDVVLVNAQNPATIYAALKTGQLQSGLLVTPLSQRSISEGLAVPLFWLNEVSPGASTNLFMASAAFLKANGDAATAFLRAYSRSAKAAESALAAGPSSDAYKELISVTAKYLSADAATLTVSPGYSVDVNADDLKAMAAYFAKIGRLSGPTPPALSDYVDLSYLQAAQRK